MSCVLCFFFIILFQLVFKSRSSEICSMTLGVHVNSGEALPICSASARTGNTILIDTSLVPHDAAIECYCSVEIDTNVQSVHILYKTVPEWADPASCGLLLKALDIVLQCPDRDGSLHKLSFSTPFLLKFSKETVSADACFVLMIDRDATVKSNGTVTCFENGVQTTASMQTTAITTHDHNTEKNTHTVLRMTTRISTNIASVFTLMLTSANEPITKENTDDSVTVNNGLTENTLEKSNTVVIAAAAGGGGVCLLMISVTFVYCYCRRINRKNSNKPVYINTCTTNTAQKAEVTENTVCDEKYHAVDDSMGKEQTHALSSSKCKSLDNDASFYNMIEDDKAVETPKGHIYMHLNRNEDTDPAYSSIELTGNTIAECKTSSVTQNNGRDKTYYNINKNS